MPLWAKKRLEGLRSVWTSQASDWNVNVAQMPPDPPLGDSYHAGIKQVTRELYRDICDAGSIPEIVARTMTKGLFQYLPEHRRFPAYMEAFAFAMRNGKATAWVCANDNQALAALQFFRENRIKVPERIALASFDNTLSSYLCNLTSYDFGFSKMGYIGLELLSRGKVVCPHHVRRIKGTVVARKSTLG